MAPHSPDDSVGSGEVKRHQQSHSRPDQTLSSHAREEKGPSALHPFQGGKALDLEKASKSNFTQTGSQRIWTRDKGLYPPNP